MWLLLKPKKYWDDSSHSVLCLCVTDLKGNQRAEGFMSDILPLKFFSLPSLTPDSFSPSVKKHEQGLESSRTFQKLWVYMDSERHLSFLFRTRCTPRCTQGLRTFMFSVSSKRGNASSLPNIAPVQNHTHWSRPSFQSARLPTPLSDFLSILSYPQNWTLSRYKPEGASAVMFFLSSATSDCPG